MSLGLPLILSDVGSARAVIEDSDIGLIVPNPFEDVRLLRTPKLLEDFTRDAKLPTLEALASAMYTIGSDRAGWRQRAQAGREKIRSAVRDRPDGRRLPGVFQRPDSVGAPRVS